MRTIYTLEDLRALGVETVSRTAILGRGKSRKGFPADGAGIVFNLERLKGDERIKVAALLAALEKGATAATRGGEDSTAEPSTARKPRGKAPAKDSG